MSNSDFLKRYIKSYYESHHNFHKRLEESILLESLHKCYIFNSMIKDNIIDDLLKKFEDNNILFYSGYCFYSEKNNDKNHIKIIPKCIKSDKIIHHPIYFYLFKDANSDKAYIESRYKLTNGKYTENDKVIIYINLYNFDTEAYKYILEHDVIHIIQSYSHENFNNALNKKNTINYGEENIFNLDKNKFEMICKYLSFLNKSEQDANISSTGLFIENLNIERIAKNIPEIIILSDEYSKHSLFKEAVNNLENLSYEDTLYIGYYMWFHHYIKDNFSKQFIINSLKIKDEDKKKKIINKIRDSYFYNFKQYEKRLYSFILEN